MDYIICGHLRLNVSLEKGLSKKFTRNLKLGEFLIRGSLVDSNCSGAYRNYSHCFFLIEAFKLFYRSFKVYIQIILILEHRNTQKA